MYTLPRGRLCNKCTLEETNYSPSSSNRENIFKWIIELQFPIERYSKVLTDVVDSENKGFFRITKTDFF